MKIEFDKVGEKILGGLKDVTFVVSDDDDEIVHYERSDDEVEKEEDQGFSVPSHVLQEGFTITVLLRGKTDEEPPRYWTLPIDVRIT